MTNNTEITALIEDNGDEAVPWINDNFLLMIFPPVILFPCYFIESDFTKPSGLNKSDLPRSLYETANSA